MNSQSAALLAVQQQQQQQRIAEAAVAAAALYNAASGGAGASLEGINGTSAAGRTSSATMAASALAAIQPTAPGQSLQHHPAGILNGGSALLEEAITLQLPNRFSINLYIKLITFPICFSIKLKIPNIQFLASSSSTTNSNRSSSCTIVHWHHRTSSVASTPRSTRCCRSAEQWWRRCKPEWRRRCCRTQFDGSIA